MESKIKIKMGALEVEYEGSEAFLKGELLKMVTALVEQQAKVPAASTPAPPPDVAAKHHTPKHGPLSGTTGSIAIKLNAQTGPDLVVAAAAQLTLVAGKEKFTRAELTKEMRTATNHFKENYVGNLSKMLKRLQEDNKLLETGANMFALSASELESLRKRIA